MASTTKLLQLRTVYRPTTTSVRFFSSSSNTSDPNEDSPRTNSTFPPPQPPPPQSQTAFSSYFSDVKAKLKQQQPGNPQSQYSGSPFSSSSPSSTSRISELGEIRKNLADFRRRSAVPPPSPPSSPSQSPQNISFQELYQRNVASRSEESSSAGSKSFGKEGMDAIREKLHQIRKTTPKTQNQRIDRVNDAMSLSRFKETLKLKPGDRREGDSSMVTRGTDNLPLSIFGKEMREKEGATANAAMKMDFVRIYRPAELGEKLRALRPQKKGKDWFSLEELNERLTKLREIEEKESRSMSKVGSVYTELKESLVVMQTADKEKPKKAVQSMDVLMQLGRTPSFMLSPPKEHLVEQYFHPDNMSASEKLKLELKKVRDEFKMSESDCGSAPVQVAQLTTKIKHLSAVLHKKDKHSKKGLQGMVQLRKKLLKYLRRTDWDSYCFVLLKLGLRDNPDYKS